MSQLPPGFVLDQPAPRGGGVYTLPTNPRTAAKDARDAEKDQRDAANEALRIQMQQQQLQLQQLKAQQDAAEFAATHNPDGSPKSAPPTAEQVQALTMKRANINSLTTQLQEVERQLNASFIGKGDRGFMEYLPTGQNRAFDAAAAGLSEQALGAFRVPGVGSQSDAELRAFVEANRPGAWEQDATNVQRVANIRVRLNEQRAAMGLPPIPDGLQGQQNDRRDPAMIGGANGAPPPMNGGNPPMAPDPWNQNTIDPTKPSSGLFLAPETRQVVDQDALAMANRIIAGGGTFTDVNREAERLGMAYRVDESYNRLLPQLREQAKGKQGFNYVQPPMKTVDNTVLERISGGGPGTAVAGFTNAMTGGTVKALTGDKYNDMMGAHPIAGGIGEVAGTVGATSLIGKGAGALVSRVAPSLLQGGKVGAFARNLMTDGAYGGIYGGITEGDPYKGYAQAVMGSLAGQGVGGALGKTLGGTSNAAKRYLAERGVSMTPGQALGGPVKWLEQRLIGQGMTDPEGFSRAAFNDALAPIGAKVPDVAEQGVEQALTAGQRAYSDALSGVNIAPNQQYLDSVNKAMADADASLGGLAPDMAANVRYTLDNKIKPLLSENMDGQAIQNLLRITGGNARQYGKLATTGVDGVPYPLAEPISNAFNAVNAETRGLLRANNPAAAEGLGKADEAWRNIKTLQEAVNTARKSEGMFGVGQLQQAAASNAKKYGGTHGTTKQPFFELTSNARQILPNNVPDSGTAIRSALLSIAPVGVAGGLGGIGAIDPQTAAALAAIGGAYSKPGRKVLTAAIAKRPEAAKQAGNWVQKRRGLFGSMGIPIVGPLLVGE